jgi:hypothetical protein
MKENEKIAPKRHKEKEFSLIDYFVFLCVTSWLKKPVRRKK